MGQGISPDERAYIAQQKAAAQAAGKEYGGDQYFKDLGAYRNNPMLGNPPPPAAPDLADVAARAGAMQAIGSIGKGRKSTFLAGPAGDTTAPATRRPTLLGG